MQISYEFRFHPIGQGLFYSGRIHADQKHFSVVYDCGSFADADHRNKVIEASGVNSPIDLLVISHFHQDHINGLKTLLKQCGGVKKVVMPYLCPEERVLYLAGPDGGFENEEYRNFITNPVSFFESNDDNIRPDVDFVVLDTKSEIKSISEGEYPQWDGSSIKEPSEEYVGNGRVRYYASTTNLRAPYWLFRFYSEPSRVSLKQIRNKFREKDIKSESLFENLGSKIGDLNQIYHELFGNNQNETSLICCHGPYISRRRYGWHGVCQSHFVGGESVALHEEMYSEEHFRIRRGQTNVASMENIHAYQMLMGDALIEDKNAYLAHYCHEINSVGAFLIPHHGSKHNWKDWFADEFRNCFFWPCSHGKPPNKKYGHPSTNFPELVNKGISFTSVNEESSARIEGDIHVN